MSYCSLSGLIAASMKFKRPGSYKIVEIGVFEGENAVSLISMVQNRGAEASYVGFDRPGQHSLDSVTAKLSAIQPAERMKLVPGDSTKTVRDNYPLIQDADFIFIDGCHDYEVAREDWQNVRPLIQKNPHLVIAFDDTTYSGVGRVRDEISSGDKDVRALSLNHNQFFVISRSMPWIEAGGFLAIDLLWRLFGKAPEA